MRRRVLIILAVAVVGAWLSATDNDFWVPQQSSLIAFLATQMNTGSDGWWHYGECYYSSGGAPDHVVAIERAAAAGCAGSDPRDVTTWCGR